MYDHGGHHHSHGGDHHHGHRRKGLSCWAYVAIIVAVLAVVGLIALGIYFGLRNKNNHHYPNQYPNNQYPSHDNYQCSYNNGQCEGTCHNTPGSYYCSCWSGYHLRSDRHTCEKIATDNCPYGYTGPNCQFEKCGSHDGWVLLRETGECFKLFAVTVTWQQGEDRCQSEGGHLVIVDSPIEIAFVDRYLWALSNELGRSVDAWVGLRMPDTNDPSTFYWPDGSPYIPLNWKTGALDGSVNMCAEWDHSDSSYGAHYGAHQCSVLETAILCEIPYVGSGK